MDDKNKNINNLDDDDFDAWLQGHSVNNLDFLKKETQTEQAKKPVPPVQSTPVHRAVPEDKPVNRRDAVRRFAMEIDESRFGVDEPQETLPEPPKNKGEVYFANHEGSLRHRAMQAPVPVNPSEPKQAERSKAQPPAKKAAERKPAKKPRAKGGTARGLFVLLIIIILTTALSATALSCLNDVLAISRDEEIVAVNIPQGAGYKEIIDILDENGLVKNAEFCKVIAGIRKFDKNKYLNGVYYLSPDMGFEGMLNEIREVQKTAETVTLFFPEGWTIYQIIAKLSEYGVCRTDHFYAVLSETDFDNEFVANIPRNQGRYQLLEGYLFPDTYEFFVGENVNSVIRKFLNNFEKKWTQGDEKRAAELGYSMDQILTIASIIQKEAANTEQMELVSSVIHNRLKNSVNYPSLGCDSTKIYIKNYVMPKVGTSVAQAFYETYDTSICTGLPAGPICNPGIEAIRAALNPDETNYYYFCHDKNKKIYMASSYAEHQRNWSQVLRVNAQ